MSSRTRREFLQIAGATAALASISEALPTKAFAAQTSSGGSGLQVFVTNETKRYAEQPKIAWSSGPGTGETITVDANKSASRFSASAVRSPMQPVGTFIRCRRQHAKNCCMSCLIHRRWDSA